MRRLCELSFFAALATVALLLPVPASATPAPSALADLEPSCIGPCRFFVEKLGTGQGTVEGANGRIDCGEICMGDTEYEEPVFLVATPASGSVFTGWIGDCEVVVARNRCDFRLNNGPVTFFAVFDREGDPPTPLEEPTGPAPPPPPRYQPPAPDLPNPRGCTIMGTGGADVIPGTARRDVICALGGNDHIHGSGGNDVVYGDGGNDRIEALGGHDRGYGGRGKDVLDGGSGNDLLDGGRGADRFLGGAGRDQIRARDRFRDTVNGGPGRDTGRVDRHDRVVALEARIR